MGFKLNGKGRICTSRFSGPTCSLSPISFNLKFQMTGANERKDPRNRERRRIDSSPSCILPINLLRPFVARPFFKGRSSLSPVVLVHSRTRPSLHPTIRPLPLSGSACLSVTSGHATQHQPSLSLHLTHSGVRSLGPRLNGIFSHFFISFSLLGVDHGRRKTLLQRAVHIALFAPTLWPNIPSSFSPTETHFL